MTQPNTVEAGERTQGGICPKCNLPFTDLQGHLTTHRENDDRIAEFDGKHSKGSTGGPWKVEDGYDGLYINSFKGCVARVTGNDDEDTANAYQMAASPELFDACAALIGYKNWSDDKGACKLGVGKVIDMARAAIAKAEGK